MVSWPQELVQQALTLLFHPDFVLMKKQADSAPLVKSLVFERLLDAYLKQSTERLPVRLGINGAGRLFADIYRQLLLNARDDYMDTLGVQEKAYLKAIISAVSEWQLPAFDHKREPTTIAEATYLAIQGSLFRLQCQFESATVRGLELSPLVAGIVLGMLGSGPLGSDASQF